MADATTFFTDEVDGKTERFGTIGAWSKTLKVPESSLRRRLEGRTGRSGKISGGQVHKDGFYPESVILEVAKVLLQEYLVADNDGFIQENGERHATANTWSKELKITSETIARRMRENGHKGITAKDKRNRILTESFFAESTVRNVCNDLLLEVPRVDEDGFFELGSIRFGTFESWERELDIGRGTIERRLKAFKGITGRDGSGQIRYESFYSEKDVLAACENLLEDIPKANQDGFIIVMNKQSGEEERLATANRWAALWGSVPGTVQNYISKAGINGISGRDSAKRIIKNGFFKEDEAREACKLLLLDLPAVNEEGFYFKNVEGSNTERYAILGTWRKVLGLAERTIERAIQGEQGIKVRDRRNKIRTAYAESMVREKCSKFLQEIPEANDEGWVFINNERCGSLVTWSRECGLSWPTLTNIMKDCPSITAKAQTGHVIGMYSESALRNQLRKYLENRPTKGKGSRLPENMDIILKFIHKDSDEVKDVEVQNPESKNSD